MENDISALFQPLRIKDMWLKNRIVMAPMHTKFASEKGEVTDRLIAYLMERARGGVGLIILENTCIDWLYGRAAGNPVTIHDDVCRSGLSNVALAVHRLGVPIITQLHHVGRQNLRANIDGRLAPVAPSAVKSKIGGDEPRPLEDHEIEEIIQMYVDAARRTKDAGFDGVELHGAHGYLLTQFFSPYTNRRDDKWGGNLENRAHFPLEVVRRIRLEVGSDFPLFYRLSAEERIPDGTTIEDTLKLVKMLDEAGVDCFDVTAGIYDSVEWIYTLQGVAPGSLIPLATAVKQVTQKPVIGVSRLGWDLSFAAKLIEEQNIDLVAIGRSLLSDPHLVKKVKIGKTKEVRRCIACNDCVAMENKGWQLHCTINPLLGNEYLAPIKPTQKSKRVLVIGGGPAGMECATVAAERGHDVTLIEGSGQLGGQLIAGSVPAYKKQEIGALIEYYAYALEKAGVKVKLNTLIKERLPENVKTDVVVIATGSVPVSPKFEVKGGQKVMNPVDVLLNRGEGCGNSIVIIGGSGVGIDIALFLAEIDGRDVTIVEKLGTVGGDMNDFLKRHTLKMIEEKKIRVLTDTEAVGVDKGKVHVDTLFGKDTLSCDTVISSIGFRPRDISSIKAFLERDGIDYFVIGTAERSGKIFDATQSGFWTGVEI